MRFPPLTPGELIYRGLLMLTVAIALWTSLLVARQSAIAPQWGDYNSYRCSTGNSNEAAVFRALTLTSRGAIEFASALCREPEAKRRFGAVEIHWQARQFLTSRHLLEEQYDYLWSRRHHVAGLVPNSDEFYTPLLETPHYALYWLSRDRDLALSREYFAGKTVGLLRDNQSQSFFQQPLRALKNAGIPLVDDQIIYFTDLNAMYGALLAGDIDVSTGGPAAPQALGDASFRTLLLADDFPSGVWYLRNHWLGTGLDCLLMQLNPVGDAFDAPPAPAVAAPHCEPPS